MEPGGGNTEEHEEGAEDQTPVSRLVSGRGIKTSGDFADFMVALMDDVVSGRVEPSVAVAACKAGDSLLSVVKMQLSQTGREQLRLSGNRIGETEIKRLSAPCEECKQPINSEFHMRKCGHGIQEGQP